MNPKLYGLGLSLTALWGTTYADQVIPNAGQLLKEQQLLQPPLPQAQAELQAPEPVSGTLTGELEILIQDVRIEGNTQFDSQTLLGLISELKGQRVTLTQLQVAVDRVSDYYRSQGYVYSRAYLPQQTLSSGTVRIAVLEAKIDQVNIQNNTRTCQSLIEATLAPLQQGEHIHYPKVQNQLKLLNRLNGVNSRNVIAPGSSTGTSQLNVQVEPTRLWQGSVGLDNFGNEFSGETRLSGNLSLNNLAGLGDQLSLDGLTTAKGLYYAKLGYDAIINGYGTQVGLSHSYLAYDLNKEMRAVGAEGSATNSSVWLKQPLVLNHQTELFLGLHYDYKSLEDDLKANQYYKHRDIDVLSIKIDGSNYDQLGYGGLSQYGVSAGYGRVDYQNQAARVLDQGSTDTQGQFVTTNAYVTRLQNLNDQGTQGYLSVYGQYSPDNLDNAEQYVMGGPLSVRGYKSSQFSGSSGYLLTGELRQPVYQQNGQQVSAKVFMDHARVKLNAEPWVGFSSNNYVSGSSAGLGLQWLSRWQLQAQLDVAFALGAKPEGMRERDDHQLWLNLKKFF